MRHSLSLNANFKKMDRTDGWQGKKGYFWEINPEKKNEVEKEITKWLNEEGRKVVENQHYYQTLTGLLKINNCMVLCAECSMKLCTTAIKMYAVVSILL